jgi:hypothetical protein
MNIIFRSRNQLHTKSRIQAKNENVSNVIAAGLDQVMSLVPTVCKHMIKQTDPTAIRMAPAKSRCLNLAISVTSLIFLVLVAGHARIKMTIEITPIGRLSELVPIENKSGEMHLLYPEDPSPSSGSRNNATQYWTTHSCNCNCAA